MAKWAGEGTMKTEELIFILDIGTRSVIGMVARPKGEMLELLAAERQEHSARAVVDGQIEDIAGTARVAGEVKVRLERTMGCELRQVHVAAAGRVLRTERVLCTLELDGSEPIGPPEVRRLEAAALQKAYETLTEHQGEEASAFCSVGHSVVGYRLDGYAFSSLLGHRGRQAEVEIIATFLPSEVVESLCTAMERIGLSVASMTLEPIAAMNAVVPRELHLLNIALVDVGAGTSDIAVTDQGSVRGYTMATVAGDEITESIMREFLVDFPMAERMKFAAGGEGETVEYEDVLGMPDAVRREELLARIEPAIEALAAEIAGGILAVNGTAPRAVFLVGGGSRTPGLRERVAAALDIEERRVAIGGSNYMKRQVLADEPYLQAEYATPVGIALTAMRQLDGGGQTVLLNGTPLPMLGSGMTVLDALRRGGYPYRQIMGRSGRNVVYCCDGVRRVARGGLPTLAGIEVNGEAAGLAVLLQPGDVITFSPATDGADAAPRLRDICGEENTFSVELLGRPAAAGRQGWVNGEPQPPDYAIQPMDRVEIRAVDTLGALLDRMGWEDRSGAGLCVGGRPVTGRDQPLRPGDRITRADWKEEAAASPPAAERLALTLNGRALTLPPRTDGEGWQLFHLLNYLDIDPHDPHGEIVLRRNGARASYLDAIGQGDRLEIHWSEEDASARVPRIPHD